MYIFGIIATIIFHRLVQADSQINNNKQIFSLDQNVNRARLEYVFSTTWITAISCWMGGFLLPLDWQVFYVQFPFPVIAGLLGGELITVVKNKAKLC